VLTRNSFEYAVFRVVPRVERQEFVNAGVVLYCKGQNYLESRIHLDRPRVLALCPDVDLELVCQHLEAIPKVCAGLPEAGPVAALSARERFRWLVAPRSTVIQVSPVHSGLCEDPAEALETLFQKLVL